MSKTWTLKCASYLKPDDIFDALASGIKTIETRQRKAPNNLKYENISPGDLLEIISLDTDKKIIRQAKRVALYDSVYQLAHTENVKSIVPWCQTADELVEFFAHAKKKWGRKYSNELDAYGIVSIELEPALK